MKSALFAFAMLAPLCARAQRTDTLTVLLPSVSVTATRTSLPARALPVTVSVFDRAALRDAGITQVSEVLRLVPGATVMTNGSYGGVTSLFLRGGESDFVQVLVDGVPMNAPGGAFDFAALTLDNIDRVEVVRGPASVLYGSDAVSGVIQIFTRTGTRKGTHLNGLVGGGSYGTRKYQAGLTGMMGGFGWSLGGATHSTDGILPYNNELRNDVLSAAGRWAGSRGDVGASVRLMDNTYHYPTNSAGVLSDNNAFTAEERVVGVFDLGVKATQRIELRARVAHNTGEPKIRDLPDSTEDNNLFTSDATVTRDVYEGRGIVKLGTSHVLTLAIEHLLDQHDESSLSESSFGSFPGSLKEERKNDGLVAQLLGNVGARTTYMAGFRRDDNSKFGVFNTGRAAAAVRLSASTSVRGSFGTAFKAPTIFENFATGFTVGNPDLNPERSRTIELGLQYATFGNKSTWGVTAFQQRFRNLIQYNGGAAFGSPNFENAAAASADGVELESAVRVGNRTSIRGSYTYLRTKVTDAGVDEGEGAIFVDSERLIRRPTHSAMIALHQTMRQSGSFDVTATYTGERDDRDFSEFPALPVRMKGFTRVDVALVSPVRSIGVIERPALVLRVENAFDSNDQHVFGFKAPGRSLFLGIRIGD